MARVLISDGTSQRTLDLVDPITIAGRSADNKIHIDDKQASRKHCQFEKTDYGYKLVDLESRNGTRVNDRVVNQALLRPGDRIVIGKHTLTFEDTQFKEPPADVAAKFAPPPAAPAPAVPPVAAAAPAPSAPSPAPPEPEPRRRRTSTGNTTAIVMQRTERVERQREQQMLRYVGVGAGVFIAVLVILIVIPSGGGPVDKAPPPRPGPGDTKKTAQSSEDEKHDFEELQQFCDKHKSEPPSFKRIREICMDFKRRYPNSPSMPQVDAYLKAVGDAERGVRGKEIDEGIAAARDEASKTLFAAAVKRINALIAKSTDDVEAREKLVKAHDEIVDQAKAHFDARKKEGRELADAGNKAGAARVFESLVASLGNESVEELALWSQIAKKSLEGLK